MRLFAVALLCALCAFAVGCGSAPNGSARSAPSEQPPGDSGEGAQRTDGQSGGDASAPHAGADAEGPPEMPLSPPESLTGPETLTGPKTLAPVVRPGEAYVAPGLSETGPTPAAPTPAAPTTAELPSSPSGETARPKFAPRFSFSDDPGLRAFPETATPFETRPANPLRAPAGERETAAPPPTMALPTSELPTSELPTSALPMTADSRVAASASDGDPLAITPRTEFAPRATARIETPAAESAGAVPEFAPAEAAVSPPPPVAASESDDFTIVKVFYGTDRLAVGAADVPAFDLRRLLPALIAAAVGLGIGVLAWRLPRRRMLLGAAAACVLLVAVGLAWQGYATRPRYPSDSVRVYGNDRGTLEVGVCEVSIPKSHRKGELESPSILRLEVREDAKRHIVLRSVVAKEHGEFIAELKQAVTASPDREVLIFIHGYNVAFEDAARRTAQMAKDLDFTGAPLLYSWPSQAGLLQYAVDETNVVWTVPHLKQFLLEVVRESDARSINVVAHSMGNRALTSALRELTYELRDEPRLFNQVVLAAPDIDADVFRRDIAPAITKTAQRVTLYASSKDRALAVSKRLHGYPRAGESGAGLVLFSEIDTIDVSDVDLSLLGHSYYGSSRKILTDLGLLIREGLPAASRGDLTASNRDGLTYWVFRGATAELGAADDRLR